MGTSTQIESLVQMQKSTHRNSPFKRCSLLLKPLREPPQSVCEGNSIVFLTKKDKQTELTCFVI